MMRAARRAACLALAVACLAGGAGARQKPSDASATLRQRVTVIEQEVDAGYGSELHVATGPHGGVQVSAWREHKVRVEARVELNAPTEGDLDALTKVIGIVVDPTATHVEITTRGPHDKKWMKGFKGFSKDLAQMPWRVDYVVWVPEYTAISVEVNDGDSVVDGVTGIISVVSAHGDVRLSNIAGATRATAAGGNVRIATHERSWRNGNLTATALGDVTLSAPPGFSAYLTASAPGGISITNAGVAKDLGGDVKQNVGAGGATVDFVAGGKIDILLGTPKPDH